MILAQVRTCLLLYRNVREFKHHVGITMRYDSALTNAA